MRFSIQCKPTGRIDLSCGNVSCALKDFRRALYRVLSCFVCHTLMMSYLADHGLHVSVIFQHFIGNILDLDQSTNVLIFWCYSYKPKLTNIRHIVSQVIVSGAKVVLVSPQTNIPVHVICSLLPIINYIYEQEWLVSGIRNTRLFLNRWVYKSPIAYIIQGWSMPSPVVYCYLVTWLQCLVVVGMMVQSRFSCPNALCFYIMFMVNNRRRVQMAV